MGALGGGRQVTCISMRPEGNETLEKRGSSLAAPSKKVQRGTKSKRKHSWPLDSMDEEAMDMEPTGMGYCTSLCIPSH